MRWIIAAVMLAMVGSAAAHDSWINNGKYYGRGQAAGQWCCGEGDCGVLDPGSVAVTSRGYVVDGIVTITLADGRQIKEHVKEVVPLAEAQPSPDGAYWRCRRPDGSRRCFFAPPPNT